jgi:hypothetical protein
MTACQLFIFERWKNLNKMSNKKILNWWDNLGIVKCINLREKYEYSKFAVLDINDYRDIYNKEFLL